MRDVVPKPQGFRALNIAVSDGLVKSWRRWFAPTLQPFQFPEHVPGEWASTLFILDSRAMVVNAEIRDTFYLYGNQRLLWLTQDEFLSLPDSLAQLLIQCRSTPLVWDLADGDEPLWEWVRKGLINSRHEELSDQVWAVSKAKVPHARTLAGRFPDSSGPNCFATVMGAAGVWSARNQWVQATEFSNWLEVHTVTSSAHAAAEPGLVMVWREAATGEPAHAAITLGEGWVLSKPSQSWYSPRAVWTLEETLAISHSDDEEVTYHQLT